MKTNAEIRAALKRGEATIGTWLQLPCPDAAEVMARQGYDWAAVDLEHGAFTRSDLPNIFRALERWGTAPFARLLSAEPDHVKAALDSGAAGLILPMIESRAQLDRAVTAALYPGGREFPNGRRGVGFARANAYGDGLSAHLDPEGGPGREVVLVAQIEDVRALGELDGILGHPRLDAYMIGPYDLSASLGRPGDFQHPDFQAAVAAIAACAEKYGLPKGFHVVHPDPVELRGKLDEGYRFLAYGVDAVFLHSGARCPLAGS